MPLRRKKQPLKKHWKYEEDPSAVTGSAGH